jgi:hypothetical protein
MKTLIACSTLLAAASLLAADKDDITGAAQKLTDADGYSWTTTTEGGRFNGSDQGKIQKDGLAWISTKRGDNTTEAVFKAGKAAVKTDDGWEAVDLTTPPARGGGGGGGGGGANPARMMGGMLRNFKAPAAQVQDIIEKTKDVTKTGDVYAADLTEEGAKGLLTMGRGRRGGGGGGGQAPAISNAKGTVKFWLKDGALSKYELKVSGTVTRNGEDTDVDRTTTVEIKDIGATKITVPDEAKSKLG